MEHARARIARAAAWLLLAMAMTEGTAAALVATDGALRFHLGPLRASASHLAQPMLVALAAAALAAWLFRAGAPRAREDGRPDRTIGRLLAIWLIGTSIALTTAPLVGSGVPTAHDVRAHFTYTYLFDRAFRQGQVPVRWVELAQPGESQPLFNFYQVGLYYFVEAVHALVPGLSASLKLTVAGFWWAGALFTFLLFRRLGFWPGVLAALTFALSPYLFLDAYVRAAYPELIAISLAVAVWWALDGWLRTGRPGYLPAYALAAGLLLISHLPTVVIVAVPMLAYVVHLLVSRQTTVRRAGLLAPVALLALGLAAFYVLPALTELHLIAIRDVTTGGFDYHQNFVYPAQWFDHRWGAGASIPGPDDRMSLQIGILQLGCLAAAAVALGLAAARRRAAPWARETAWWLAVATFGLFMMTAGSLPVWNAIPPLRFLQFPWRFFVLVVIACAGVAAVLLSLVPGRALRAVIVGCAGVGLWTFAHPALRFAHDAPRETLHIDDPGWAASDEGQRLGFVERGYDPAGTDRPPPAAVNRWTVVRGSGTVAGEEVTDARLRLAATSADGLQLVINSRAFPDWRVRIDGTDQPVRVLPVSGYLVVDVPPGAHHVDAALTDTPIRTAANRLTLASLLLWIVGAFLIARSGRLGLRGGAPNRRAARQRSVRSPTRVGDDAQPRSR
jgi:hypothetical protein